MARWTSLSSLLLATCAALSAVSGVASAAVADPGAGTYFGIFQGGSFDQSGYVKVVIGKSGVGTVGVKVGNQANCAVEIGPGGTISGGPIVYRPVNPNPPMQVNLSLIELPQGGTALSGTIIDDWGDVISLTIPSTTPSVAARALAGRYTLLLETASAGSAFSNNLAGVGALHIFKTGRLLFLGTLADGTSVAQSGALNSAGGWSLYVKQANGNVLSGDVTFADETQTDLTGALVLSGPGINNESSQLVGSQYDPAVAWTAAPTWTLTTSDDGGATVALSSSLTAHGDRLVSAAKAAGIKLTPVPGGPIPAAAFLETATGRVLGGYGTGILDLHALFGVVFQKTGGAFGFTTSFQGLSTPEILGAIDGNPALLRSAANRTLASALPRLKTAPSGIFALEPNPGATSEGGTFTVIGVTRGNVGDVFSLARP